MSGWGISEKASRKEKIKSEYADYLNGLNSTGAIDWNVYSEMFDVGMALMDEIYEQGRLDTSTVDYVPVVRCKDCKYIERCGVSDTFYCADGVGAGWEVGSNETDPV